MSGADVAIVGLACRFPGDAKSPEAFGEMLFNSQDAWTKVPESRFNVDAFYHPFRDRRGNMVCNGGYFLQDDVTKWDAPFFAMSAMEARAVDPQQRLLLEIAYESLESAGIPVEAIANTDTACYVGGFTGDYKSIITRDIHDMPQYAMTGCASSMLSNRISWFLNLRGPSLTMDSACSSATAALHLACETIRSNSNPTRCALVGGSSLILDPDDPCAFSTLGFLSPDSRSFAFDSRANGYARGEGVCMLVVKHIDDAIRDGDPIRAVIRATGSNSDGRTAGIVLPNSNAQQQLVQDTYRMAGLDPADTQYVEMHGTGTKVGDPAEMGAVMRSMAAERTSPLYCGSVKTQIGHLEAAAGIAGIIKCVLAMERGVIPPNLNFVKPNPGLRLEGSKMVVSTSPVPWPEAGVRRCSVNSFGFGGTNVHVVLEDARSYWSRRGAAMSAVGPGGSSSDCATPYIFVLSSPEQDAVARQRQAHNDYIQDRDVDILPPLAYTLSQRRSLFQWRHAVVADSVDGLLGGWADRSLDPAKATESNRVALLFTGQGAQWAGMGRELVAYEPYARSVRASAAALTDLGCTWDAWAELMAPEAESHINCAEYSQPLCLVFQIALVDLLRHWGVVASAVVGHSSGEIAAAYAAGALSRENCLKVALHRGLVSKMAQTRSPNGGMMAVGLSAENVRPYLTDSVHLACINGPSSVTLAGDKTHLARLEGTFNQQAIFCRLLRVDNAYHSPQMHSVSEEYRKSIADIIPNDAGSSSATFHSSVYGRKMASSELTADYWVANLCSTVDLVSALDDMMGANSNERRPKLPNCILEVGPHGALGGSVNQFRNANRSMEHTTYHSLLTRKQDARLTAMRAAASLWTKGVPIWIDRVNRLDDKSNHPSVLVDLPSYRWNHSTSYWHENRLSKNHRYPLFPKHDLIGSRLDSFNPLEPTWTNYLRISELPWLKDHQVLGDIVFPATGYISAVIEAVRQLEQEAGTLQNITGFQLSELSFSQPLILPSNGKGVETHLHLKRRTNGMGGTASPWLEFSISSCQEGDVFVEHSCGLIQAQHSKPVNEVDGGRELREETLAYKNYWESNSGRCTDAVCSTTHYGFCNGLGINYGKSFQNLTKISQSGATVAFEVMVPESRSFMPKSHESAYLIHPATLDALLQSIFVAVRTADGVPRKAWVPTTVGSMLISSAIPNDPGTALHGISETAFIGHHQVTASLMAGDGTFDILPWITVEGLGATGLAITITSPQAPEVANHNLYSSVVWKPDLDLLDGPGLRTSMGNTDQRDHTMAHFCSDGHEIVNELCGLALSRLGKTTESELPPHLVKYVQWMRSRCGTSVCDTPTPSDGSQTGESEYWGIARLPGFVDQYPVDGNLLCHVMSSLDALFAQETTAIASLMTTEYFARFYTEAYGADTNTQAFKSWFDLKAHKVPSLRVIEIGAGTAATTVPVLKQLGDEEGATPRLSEYTFTNISPGWFEKAKNLLSDWQSYVEYKVLDIENDPVEQGFEAGSYDVVLAVNVLHATKDIHTTLQNCRRLLKPGGNLVLGEITNPGDLVGFIFGTLPGWWAAEDGRQNGPLLLRHQWDNALKQAGFSGTDISITDKNDGDADAHRMSTIVSTKLHETGPASSKDVVVIIPDDPIGDTAKGLAVFICQEMQALGVRAAIKDLTDATAGLEGKTIISLLEFEKPLLEEIQEKQFKHVQQLLLYSAEVLWVTRSDPADGPRHPSKGIVSGLLRCLKMEDVTRQLYEMHFSRELDGGVESTSRSICRRLDSIWHADKERSEEMETSERDDVFCIPRYMPERDMNRSLARAMEADAMPQITTLVQAGRPLKLAIGQPGSLDTLHFVDDDTGSKPLLDDEVGIDVFACGLNFRDVLIAMGELQRPVLGHEAIGIVRCVGARVQGLAPGDRVVCVKGGVMKMYIRCHESSVYPVPANLSDGEAVSIPIAYATAYQSLVEVARLQEGESVLIHTAAGGLGQALIQLAKTLKGEIFCTVSTEAKKQLVVSLGVKPENVFSSRDLSFEKGIKRATRGRGVDIVVNSLAGEALRRSWTCLAPYGRFIEVGLKDIISNAGLDMRPFLNNCTFSCVNLDNMMTDSRQRWPVLTKVLQLFGEGALGPIRPIVTHDFSNVKGAFREMQRGSHVGKLVLRFTPESRGPVMPPRTVPLKLAPDATYVLVGGLGGLGRAQAEFMAEHGARHLVFISRSGSARQEAKDLIAKLAAAGVETKAYASDVADKARLKDILNDVSQNMPPIRGVIQGAMVLEDTLFHKMNYQQWIAATRPKVQGSWNLHELLPDNLDFFIVLSSLAGIIGSSSQANYAAANTYQDALVHYRQSKGLAAQSLNLCVIKEVGYIAEHKEIAAVLSPFQLPSIDQQQFFHLLKCALAGTPDRERPLTNQILVGAGSGGMMQEVQKTATDADLYWLSALSPFAYLRQFDVQADSTAVTDNQVNADKLLDRLRNSKSIDEATDAVQDMLLAKIASIISVPTADINVAKPVYTYGVDSLVAVELRNWLAKSLRSDLSILDLTSNTPITELSRKIASRSRWVSSVEAQ